MRADGETRTLGAEARWLAGGNSTGSICGRWPWCVTPGVVGLAALVIGAVSVPGAATATTQGAAPAGFLNIDAPVPRPEVAAHGTNKWCIKAAPFPLAGAEIAVEYLLPNGDKVSFRGSVFPTIFGGGSEGCHVTGPRPTYTCKATRTHRGLQADVDFVVAPNSR